MHPAAETPPPTRNLVLYDGVCALCNASVRFLLRIDRGRKLTFASIQGETAGEIRARREVPENLDAMLLVQGFETPAETVHTGSTAVLESLAIVGGPWRIVSSLRIVPLPVRELVYRWVARNRYRWFGRHDTCPLPPPEVSDRFLD